MMDQSGEGGTSSGIVKNNFWEQRKDKRMRRGIEEFFRGRCARWLRSWWS